MTPLPINFERHEGLLDRRLLSCTRIAVVGVGGAAGLVKDLARLGVGTLHLVDFDYVSNTNPATQSFGAHQHGEWKVEALADDLARINPEVRVVAHGRHVEALTAREWEMIARFDLILAMTDSPAAQLLLNRFALQTGIDTLFAAAYPGASATEITGTFSDSPAGCHLCLAWPRYEALAGGHRREKRIPSHVFQASFLNAQLGLLVISLLHHRAGSALGNPGLAERFLRSPLIVTRLDTERFPTEFGETARDQNLFACKQFGPQRPAFVHCPHCGARPPALTPGDQERDHNQGAL
ncbi:MAG: ThiF family adenylyltransferase [Pseudomonadota bacterium]